MTTLEEIEQKKEQEGVICVVDRCVLPTGESFNVDGERCSECDCGFVREALNVTDVNFIRLKYSQTKIAK